MQRNIQAIHVMIRFAKVTIVYAFTRNNHCVKLINREIYVTQKKNDSKAFICTDEVCKGNDCVNGSDEQTLYKDIGCEYSKEGRCITKEECDKYIATSKGYTCTDDTVPITTTTDPTHAAKLSSHELRIFLRYPNIERSPTIKSSCKNIICNHKYSVQAVER